MAPVNIPANLPDLVRAAFSRAVAGGDVFFFPSQVTLIAVNSIPFQLRFSPALANKPRAPQPPAPTTADPPPGSEPPKPFFDPFDNPAEAMLIAPLGSTHNLVLNKFAVVPEHFILATRAFKEQTHLLDRADLDTAYACIAAYHAHASSPDTTAATAGSLSDGCVDGPDPQKTELYVFYNSGVASGSSQPHRHLQLLPVSRMREGLGADEDAAWDVLAGRLLDAETRRRVPFRTFAERIGPGVDLMAVYLRLYRRACEAVLGSGVSLAAAGEARVDYNLAMTGDAMVVAPRVAEGAPVSAPGDGGARKPIGMLGLNGTVLAGTALVKTKDEWDALRAEPEQLLELLGRIGVPNVEAPPPA